MLGSYSSKIRLWKRTESFSSNLSWVVTALSHPGRSELTFPVIVPESEVLGSAVQHPDFLVVKQIGSGCVWADQFSQESKTVSGTMLG